ncbi:class I SAM-dependent methyltransferase [bacterium]|nr:class I SAM-dependent methyltransferase [bacterium]
MENKNLKKEIASYWNSRIHDLEIAKHPVGSREFFEELAEYRFDKLNYLPKIVDFKGFKGKKILEIGCGVGIDLAEFAAGGALVTGIDLSQTAIDLAGKYFSHLGLSGDFKIMDGEAMSFADNTFDVVYAHGVLQYTENAVKMAEEAYRVLKPGGQFIAMVYNRKGWLNFMSRVFKVSLEHEDAPVLEKYTIDEFREILSPFINVKIVPERFPVRSRLHGGLKGVLFNTLFVGAFKIIPKPIVKKWGWHLMGFGEK